MKNYFSYFILLVVMICLPLTAVGQTYHGFSFDNYGGIYNVTANPANSVESKHKLHVGLSYNRWNISDYDNGAVDLLKVETIPNGFNGLDFSQNNGEGSNDNIMLSNSDVMLAGMLWGFHEKHALGLTVRSRSFSDYQGFNGNLWAALNGEAPTTAVGGESIFNNTVHQWDEIGLNYGLVLVNGNYHFLKFGGTLKLLAGRGGTEVRGSITTNDAGSVTEVSELTYLNTFSNERLPGSLSELEPFYTNALGLSFDHFGVGGDVGLVYEWRPRETNRVGSRNSSSSVNVYKLRISAAILDIGAISYGDENEFEQKSVFNYDGNATLDATNVTNFFQNLSDNDSTTPQDDRIQQGSVTFALPRSLNIGLDYILFNDKNYYINLNYRTGLTKIDEEYANTASDVITFTPRYETRDFSGYISVSYEKNTGIYAGAGVRYKYLTAGCAALNTFIQDQPLNHIFIGLSFPILEEVF